MVLSIDVPGARIVGCGWYLDAQAGSLSQLVKLFSTSQGVLAATEITPGFEPERLAGKSMAKDGLGSFCMRFPAANTSMRLWLVPLSARSIAFEMSWDWTPPGIPQLPLIMSAPSSLALSMASASQAVLLYHCVIPLSLT